MPLHLTNSDLHAVIRSSLAGDSHTAVSALHFLDIAYSAEAKTCVDDTKIVPPQPTKEPCDSWWYFRHGLTALDTMYALLRTTVLFFLGFARSEKISVPYYRN